jgi:hypothetical protein
MATFACMQLIPKGALVPSLHSPNTPLKALYCRPLLMRSGMQAIYCQHIKSLRGFAGEALLCPVRHPGDESHLPERRAVLTLKTRAPGPNSPSLSARLSRSSFCYVRNASFAFCICTWAQSALNHQVLQPSHLELVSYTLR